MITRRKFLAEVTTLFCGACIPSIQQPFLKFQSDIGNGYVVLEDNTKVYYEKILGDLSLPSVVYVHGFFIGHLVTSKILDGFVNNPKVLYDLPGHGRSEEYYDKEYTMSHLASTLDMIIEETGTKKPILVGHSLGGMIAFQYLVDYPLKARSAVIINAHHKSPRLFGMENFFRTLNVDITPAFFSYLSAMSNYDIESKINKLTIPLLFMNSKDDPFIPNREIDGMVALLDTPFKDYRLERESHLFSSKGFNKLTNIIAENLEFLAD